MRSIWLAPLLALSSVALAEPVFRLGDDVVPVSQDILLTVDPAKDAYTGSITVDLDVKRPVKNFRLHALGPKVTAARLMRDDRGLPVAHAPGDHDTVVITPERPLEPGRHRLELDFDAPFNRQAVGLYKVVHKDQPYLFTQLEAIDARRAFPCWDEPGFKIPYQLTVVVPAGMEAVSNTPIERSVDEKGGHRVKFARTKPLPSYLLALAVGSFESTPIKGMSMPGNVVAPRGEGAAKLAAEVTPGIVAALERYTGMKYPYEKLDLIAVPEYWFGAMENPGAIVFNDAILLVDEKDASIERRRILIGVIAHEVAHMWFGDLVTMAWWDDFWLNESFASWLGDKVSAETHPELEIEMKVEEAAQVAMGRDVRPATQAIRLAGITPEEAMRTVGNVYDKGQTVLGMFERFVGEDRFREGIRGYFAKYAWKNATTRDFFEAIGKHAPPGVADAMQSFVVQPGVPLVTVERDGPRALRLRQDRFLTTGKAPPLAWTIPVSLKVAGAAKPLTVLFEGPEHTVELAAEAAWIFPQVGGSGYYRWQLSAADLAALARVAGKELTPRERVSLLGNSAALFGAGRLEGDSYLQVLDALVVDPDADVQLAVVAELRKLTQVFDTPSTRATVAAYVRRRLAPVLERVGWTPRPGEPRAVTDLRPALITALAVDGRDEAVRQRARVEASKFVADETSIDPSLITAVLHVSAREGDAKLFDEYRRRFEGARTPIERRRFAAALGSFARPEVRARGLAYALSGKMNPPELFFVPFGAIQTAKERDLNFDWFMKNYDTLVKRIPTVFLAEAAQLAGGCEPERIARAKTFFAKHSVEGMQEALARVAEITDECAALRKREMKAVVAHMRK